MVLAEAGARWLGPRLEEPVVWGDSAQAVKAAQMDDLAGVGCVPVVVAGNSMVRDAVVPSIVVDRLGGSRVYNASLDAAGPELLEPWLVDQVVPRLRPATVVVGLASVDLNTASPAASAAAEAYRSAPEGRTGVLGALDRAVRRRLALVRHRGELRRPQLVWDALGGDRSPGPDREDGRPVLAGVLGPDGEGRSRAALVDPGPSGPGARFAAEQLLAGFDLGPDPAARVTGLLDAVRGAGGGGRDVVVLLLPVTPAFGDLHPGGPPQQVEAEQAILDGAERAGAPVVDLRDLDLPDAAFADTHHLNATGASAVSTALGDALAGTEETPRARTGCGSRRLTP